MEKKDNNHTNIQDLQVLQRKLKQSKKERAEDRVITSPKVASKGSTEV